MPRMGLQRVPRQKFLGLNTRDSPYDLPPGKSPDTLNTRPNPGDPEFESVGKRKGLTFKVNGWWSTVGTAAMDHGIGGVWGLQMSGGGSLWTTIGVPTDAGTVTIFKDFDAGLYTGGWLFAVEFVPGAPGASTVFCMPSEDAGSVIPQKKALGGSGTANWVITGLTRPLKSMAYWRGRLVGTGDMQSQDRVQYSNTGDPNTWGNFIDIFDEYGSKNVGLVAHNNNLYLFKERTVWMIYDPNSFASRLISPVGTGIIDPGATSSLRDYPTQVMVSNPFDKRLYWFNQAEGRIYSTNGETDLIVENEECRIPEASRGAGSPGRALARMVVDPVTGSTLLAWSTTPGSATENDRIDEITLAGSPGAHEIFRHTIRTKMLCLGAVKRTGTGEPVPVVMSTQNSQVARVYETFGSNDSDDGTAINGYWKGGWMPIISEEPTERIRRVNFLYRGTPIIDVASALVPVVNPAVFTVTPAAFAGASDTDRTYLSAKGPNKKGRYHQLMVRNSVLNESFDLSAVEFVIRGGKEKK